MLNSINLQAAGTDPEILTETRGIHPKLATQGLNYTCSCTLGLYIGPTSDWLHICTMHSITKSYTLHA